MRGRRPLSVLPLNSPCDTKGARFKGLNRYIAEDDARFAKKNPDGLARTCGSGKPSEHLVVNVPANDAVRNAACRVCHYRCVFELTARQVGVEQGAQFFVVVGHGSIELLLRSILPPRRAT